MPYRKKKVLIIDDEDSVRLVTSRAVTFAGYEALTANGADEGMAIIRREPIRLILLDIMMPNKSGFDLLRDLHSDPTTKDIPVIVLTALSSTADNETARAAGAVDVIVKPIGVKELQEVVKKQLGPSMESDAAG